MILTEDMIKNLPVITEEEEKNDYYDESFFEEDLKALLEEFNKRCDIIDEMHDRYRGILTHKEITQKINEEFKRQGIECILKLN
jgi:hypothetical protein